MNNKKLETRVQKLEDVYGPDETVVIGVSWGDIEKDEVTFISPAERKGETMLLKDFQEEYAGEENKVINLKWDEDENGI